jgi:uncharacterized membrane protein YfcA
MPCLLTPVVILLLVGLAAGMLSGLVGVGGGIIIVPCLVLLLGFTQKEAQGTSLAILLLPIGVFAVFEYYKQGQINITYALMVAVAFLVGSYLGSKIALSVDEQKLKKMFAVTLMLLSIRMLFFEKPKHNDLPPAKTTSTASNDNMRLP